MPFTTSSTKPHQLQTMNTDGDKQRVTTAAGLEWRRQKPDVRINLENTSTFETALNDLALLSTRNQSTSSGISSATSTNKFGRKVLNSCSCTCSVHFSFNWYSIFLLPSRSPLPSPSLRERRRYCVAWRPSRCHAVCVRRINLDGEGNALYPILSSYHYVSIYIIVYFPLFLNPSFSFSPVYYTSVLLFSSKNAV